MSTLASKEVVIRTTKERKEKIRTGSLDFIMGEVLVLPFLFFWGRAGRSDVRLGWRASFLFYD